jgi:hypothetical protein
MKTNHRTLGLLFASLLLFCACGCSSIAEYRRLSWLNTADPKHDCAAAVARGDLRFCAVNGIAPGMVLGTDQCGADRALIQAYGVRTIVGTSDTSVSRLNRRASEYARAYNVTLLRYLRANTNRPPQ